jgi:hypothetical protein
MFLSLILKFWKKIKSFHKDEQSGLCAKEKKLIPNRNMQGFIKMQPTYSKDFEIITCGTFIIFIILIILLDSFIHINLKDKLWDVCLAHFSSLFMFQSKIEKFVL